MRAIIVNRKNASKNLKVPFRGLQNKFVMGITKVLWLRHICINHNAKKRRTLGGFVEAVEFKTGVAGAHVDEQQYPPTRKHSNLVCGSKKPEGAATTNDEKNCYPHTMAKESLTVKRKFPSSANTFPPKVVSLGHLLRLVKTICVGSEQLLPQQQPEICILRTQQDNHHERARVLDKF